MEEKTGTETQRTSIEDVQTIKNVDMAVRIATVKNMAARQTPQKIRSKKKRRALAKKARRSRKTNR